MSAWIGAWISLWRWRWWSDAGAEIARRAVLVPKNADCEAVERLRVRMLFLQGVARWVPGSRCLDRALSLAEWADAHGLPAHLCIGVKTSGQNMKAHAWVECGNVIIDPDPHATALFVPLQSGLTKLEFD